MSLEAKIETLTATIEKLILVLSTAPEPTTETTNVVPKQQSEPETVADVEPDKQPEQSLTHKDVQDRVLSIVRKDTDKKAVIKTLLGKFKCSKVGDLKESDLSAFNAELDAL